MFSPNFLYSLPEELGRRARTRRTRRTLGHVVLWFVCYGVVLRSSLRGVPFLWYTCLRDIVRREFLQNFTSLREVVSVESLIWSPVSRCPQVICGGNSREGFPCILFTLECHVLVRVLECKSEFVFARFLQATCA